MKLHPFTSVDELAFSLTPEQLVARRGRPHEQSRSAIGLQEYDYGDEIYRFQGCGRLEEVTKRAVAVHLGGVSVPFGSLRGFVLARDPAAFERAGFVISPRYGLAFAPESPNWVTALAEHCIPTWRSL